MKKRIQQLLLPLLVVFPWLASCAAALPVIYISAQSAVHFRSPEPIKYVDLPGANFTGDLPQENLLRLRFKDSFAVSDRKELGSFGIITITGEHYFAQYQLMAANEWQAGDSEVEILPSHMLPLIPALPSLSTPQMHAKSIALISRRASKALASAKNQGVSLKLNQLRCSGELIFLDLSFYNEAELRYDIEDLSFVISDKKISRASNFQSIEIKPTFTLSPLIGFAHAARNIYVLPKMSFSAAKRLKITLSEKQPSSRAVTLELSYGELLSADSF
ncbi:DUF4138 domain-containing protein [Pedobacter jamesrossensis]|uniref:DUF4138 domain-containing protein n=1 Tax=Pedobacter jamesrossensis TaxID=1908238 RepID=A0ABV8NS67_9SPHI